MKTEKTIYEIKCDFLIDQLRAEYENKGLTQDIIAEKTGLQRQTINRFFSKRFTPRFDMFLKISDALNYEIVIKKKNNNSQILKDKKMLEEVQKLIVKYLLENLPILASKKDVIVGENIITIETSYDLATKDNDGHYIFSKELSDLYTFISKLSIIHNFKYKFDFKDTKSVDVVLISLI